MPITITDNIFKLDTAHTSYVFKIAEFGYLMHQYYGQRISDCDLDFSAQLQERSFSPNPSGACNRNFSLDTLPQEYSCCGIGDFRATSIEILHNDGHNTVDLRYVRHFVLSHKPPLSGLPSCTDAAGDDETLCVVLRDSVSNIDVVLSYTVFEKSDFITRSVRIENNGISRVNIQKMMSFCLDFPAENYDILQLPGAWANERQAERYPLHHGVQGFCSKRGTSSHQYNPFFAICMQDTTEFCGDAYGFSLVYSGNHMAEIEKTQIDTIRCTMGINPDGFHWLLSPGDSFTAPEVVLAFSSNGLNGMSQIYHNIVRNHLCQNKWQHQRRPTLINNWEATYFDFNEARLLTIAKQAAALDIEMLVLDDGWFGKRNDDTTSLGDWSVNTQKLPDGLAGLEKKLSAMHMKLGLWIEPEMISKESELYRTHKDWCLSQPLRSQTTGRNQFVLDFSRKEVRDAIWEQLNSILKNIPLAYLKWDMNRHLTEVGSGAFPPEKQGEIYHRYVLGVYDLMYRITSTYPDILLENCSGGGGRFDLGMLYYSPQIWTSDNTDAFARTKIQYGTSYCYPLSAMGCHVSAVPNHQTGRYTSIKARGDVAIWGAFGFEMDLQTLTDAEKQIVKEQCAFYKKHALTLQNGTMYRLLSPFDGNACAWAVLSEQKDEIFVFCMVCITQANAPQHFIKLPFAPIDTCYTISGTTQTLYGSTLRGIGLPIPRSTQDYQTTVWHLKAM